MITETDEILHGLELAAEMWPSDKDERSSLLRHIIATGIQALDAEKSQKLAERKAAIAEIASGKFSLCWPEGYLEELRNEWPE